ncbi:sialate O-acetylesterase [Niabella aurantiaca]|uniref:sialate O-acetylesterase n=1 Tax=Niabella aurantiaca TaxID=379900 RepID=UPI0003824A82|nr:sialate O-acetylesterase [Niabella aurantiaca]
MKTILLFFCMAVSAKAGAQSDGQDPDLHLYLLIGQSNMAGRGPLDEAGKKEDPRILMLDSLDQWVVATDPVHFDKPKMAGVGPGRAFAAGMLKTGKKVRIGLIPCAWGGSPIRVWQPDARYFKARPYDDALRRARIAMQKGVLKGVLWHQGESDNDTVHAAVYMARLEELVARLRTDLKDPHLPFVAGEIGYFNKKGTLINTIIDQLPQQVPGTAVVSAKGLMHKGDSVHFDTPSARELGRRYAAAMKQLQDSAGRGAE